MIYATTVLSIGRHNREFRREIDRQLPDITTEKFLLQDQVFLAE